jgi:hypothetical protein
MIRRAGLAAALLLIAAPARADGVDLAVFSPTPSTTGTGFQLQSPDVGADGSWVVSSILSFASNPLVLDAFDPHDNVTHDAVVKRSSLLELGAAYAFLDRFEVGAFLPLYMQSGDAVQPTRTFSQRPASGTATGNLTLHAKLRLARAESGLGTFSLGASVSASVPTASTDQFTGTDKPEGRGLVLAAFTPSGLSSRLTFSVNAGGVVRARTEYANIVQKSAIDWGAGVAVRVVDPLWATAEIFGESTPGGQRDAMSTTVLSPVEWLAGLTFRAERRFTIGLAAGRGVTDGLGTPDVRGMLSLSFVPGSPAVAPIHPPGPIKPDGDADGDGIPDSVDKCPNEPEDFDMFEDTDGCPDLDNDHDGIPDAVDKCPLDPEDKDGFQDEDGCPDKDNDGDGIPDDKDKCPNLAEDKDGFEDLDGCPDLDNDHDGIPDAQDKCPNEPETINGFQDDDGCPDKGDTAIILSPDRIETLDPIQLTGAGKLTRASLPLIEQVGATLRAHPEIVRVRISAHAQPSDNPDADQARTDKRAQAVRDWLVNWGIAPARLEARGFGGKKPLVPPDQRGAAKINERIELIILERR